MSHSSKEVIVVVILLIVGFAGMLFAIWPIVQSGAEAIHHRWVGWRRWRVGGQGYLSSHEQLLKLMDGDRRSVQLLINEMRLQYPGRADEWYSEMVLEQLKLWIVNKLSSTSHEPSFGMNQLAVYTLKYPYSPDWWVYRKLATDFHLFKK